MITWTLTREFVIAELSRYEDRLVPASSASQGGRLRLCPDQDKHPRTLKPPSGCLCARRGVRREHQASVTLSPQQADPRKLKAFGSREGLHQMKCSCTCPALQYRCLL